jgi:hypothetical protein
MTLLRRSLLTANFLVISKDRPFSWGDWDCNLFIVDLLDHIDAGMPWRSQSIRGKYDTRFGAAKFQYYYTPAPDWLEKNGYEIVLKTPEEFQDQDIVLEKKKRYWTASLRFGGYLWSVVEDKGLMMTTIEPGEYQVGVYRG